MTYKVIQALVIMENNYRKNIMCNNEVEDLESFKKTLISEYNAKEIYLSYEQENNDLEFSNSNITDNFKHLTIQ